MTANYCCQALLHDRASTFNHRRILSIFRYCRLFCRSTHNSTAPSLGSFLILKTTLALIYCTAVLPSGNGVCTPCWHISIATWLSWHVRVLYTRGYGRIMQTDFEFIGHYTSHIHPEIFANILSFSFCYICYCGHRYTQTPHFATG
jgi:hypothetical protein